ncbi:helix-turn-helix domain-containing protein [uncultured Polaribacter sp.]|uniref:helix-turn-helix domain-containing protein n=1 Tax=uncultured Polaribacter sp. TaxID=174711 RepID=UPI003703733E
MEILLSIFVFSFYVFIKNIKNIKLTFLSFTLLIFSIYAIAHFAVNSDDYSVLKTILYNHFTPLYLLAGPSYYYFIRTSLDSKFKFSYKSLIHLLPFIIQVIGIIPYTLSPWDDKYRLVNEIFLSPEIQNELNTNAFFSSMFNVIFRFSHFLFYITWAVILLKKNKELENAKKIKPFLKISLSFIGIVVFYYLHILLIIYKGSYNIWGIKIIIYIDLILLVSLIVQFIKHPELYIRKSKIKLSYLISSPFTKSTNHNKKLVISQKDIEIIQDRIQILINERFFFTDPKNNFQEFSKLIKYPDYIIRLYLKSQESSYIDIKNKVRLTVAKDLLEKTKLTYDLNYIAEKSGFNSKSNFYSIFKKYEKCSPREYVK